MSVLAANDLKATHAPARPDDDGAPPAVMLPTARDAQGRPSCASLPREGNSVMPEPAATRPPPANPPPRRYIYPDGSALGPAKVPAGLAIAAVADRGCRAEQVCGRR
jgi:hypothetical protein